MRHKMIPRSKISKGGKVVIPAFLRKKLDIKEGEEVTFQLQEDNIVITSLRHTLEKARRTVNRYHPSNESLVDKLITTRREESENE